MWIDGYCNDAVIQPNEYKIIISWLENSFKYEPLKSH